MVQRIRAHFDGHVIVPDEPVDLPRNQPLTVDIRATSSANGTSDRAEIERRLRALQSVTGIISGPPIPDEALRRENLYD